LLWKGCGFTRCVTSEDKLTSSFRTRVALIAALEREVSPLIKNWTRVPRSHEGRNYIFFEYDDTVCVCGGIGLEAARRAAEAVIALYNPFLLHSVGFAGALTKDAALRVGNIFSPSLVLDARDGSRFQLATGHGTLVTFMDVAGASQKAKLSQAYAAQAVDMEAAAVAAAASAHNLAFAATKVISDELDFEMLATSRFISSDGRFHTANFALFAALRPWLWNRVFTLAANSAKAAKSLAAHLNHFSPDSKTSPTPTTLSAGGRH
jgi:adenosylhomocysteine nucleosidase